MSLISKLFGKSSKEVASKMNENVDPFSEVNTEAFENLFVNDEMPEVMAPASEKTSTGISSFLEQDYYKKGFEDGYDGHSSEVLDHKLRTIRADFRYNSSLKIDSLRQDLLSLQNQKEEVKDLSFALTAQLTNSIDIINLNITELESQMELSAEDEGMVMSPIHHYRDGFIKGTSAYQQEKRIGISTGLFN